MRLRHVIQRGNTYSFVCRVPKDLRHLFPTAIIWKSIKALGMKNVRLLAGVLEQRTQKLFLELRTGMLTREMENSRINDFLYHGVVALEARATGQSPSEISNLDKREIAALGIDQNLWESWQRKTGLPGDQWRESLIQFIEAEISQLRKVIIEKNTDYLGPDIVSAITKSTKSEFGFKIAETAAKALALRYANTAIELRQAELAVLRGNLTPLDLLKDRVTEHLKSPYRDFASVLTYYMEEYYPAEKPDVKQGTIADMRVQCKVLLELIGNINIQSVNTALTVTSVKNELRTYPLNRHKIFGDKSLAWIRKNVKGYKIIKLNTANVYIMRLSDVIKCALENGIVTGINAASGKCFPDDQVPELDRKSYDKGDVERLVDALCTKPLYGQKEKKDYRFWIILIALFHGFRLSNITNLTKEMIIIKDELVGFDFTQYTIKDVKTADALQFFPMHWALQAIGFSDWVVRQRAGRLFKDSSSTFSKWYNHDDKNKDGTIRSQGFEPKFITTDPKKCLYSLRHNFDNALVKAGVDFKYIKELMTHAPDKRDQTRSRYLKRDDEALMRALDAMVLQGIDLDRLEARAIELFDI